MKTDLLDIRNMDCMELMAQYPDNQFDLAVVDPHYGIGESLNKRGGQKHGNAKCESKDYGAKEWDRSSPPIEYFQELERVSKNMIIWGANHFMGKIKKPRWEKGGVGKRGKFRGGPFI